MEPQSPLATAATDENISLGIYVSVWDRDANVRDGVDGDRTGEKIKPGEKVTVYERQLDSKGREWYRHSKGGWTVARTLNTAKTLILHKCSHAYNVPPRIYRVVNPAYAQGLSMGQEIQVTEARVDAAGNNYLKHSEGWTIQTQNGAPVVELVSPPLGQYKQTWAHGAPANVRASACKGAAKIGKVHPGETITVYEYTMDEKNQRFFRHSGGSGGWTLEFDSGPDRNRIFEPFPEKDPLDEYIQIWDRKIAASLRKGPGRQYPKIGEVQPGQIVQIFEAIINSERQSWLRTAGGWVVEFALNNSQRIMMPVEEAKNFLFKSEAHEHTLERFDHVYHGNYICNICKGTKNGIAFHCTPCRYDICPECVTNEQDGKGTASSGFEEYVKMIEAAVLYNKIDHTEGMRLSDLLEKYGITDAQHLEALKRCGLDEVGFEHTFSSMVTNATSVFNPVTGEFEYSKPRVVTADDNDDFFG